MCSNIQEAISILDSLRKTTEDELKNENARYANESSTVLPRESTIKDSIVRLRKEFSNMSHESSSTIYSEIDKRVNIQLFGAFNVLLNVLIFRLNSLRFVMKKAKTSLLTKSRLQVRVS